MSVGKHSKERRLVKSFLYVSDCGFPKTAKTWSLGLTDTCSLVRSETPWMENVPISPVHAANGYAYAEGPSRRLARLAGLRLAHLPRAFSGESALSFRRTEGGLRLELVSGPARVPV